MMNRTADAAVIPPLSERATTQVRSAPWRVNLVKVPSGVAAGRTRHVQGNAQMESWALFMNRAQFDDFMATDSLRHVDPLRFAQLKREFDHAFDRSETPDLNS